MKINDEDGGLATTSDHNWIDVKVSTGKMGKTKDDKGRWGKARLEYSQQN